MIQVPQDNEYKPNTWTEFKTTTGRSADYVCPNGHLGGLGDHTIADDGTVSPSVVCPRPGCDFHDHIRLVDWEV